VNPTKSEQLEANPAAAILLEFREGRATDMETLYRAFGLRWPPQTRERLDDTLPFRLDSIVEKLVGIGLLQADDSNDGQLSEWGTRIPNLWLSKIRTTELLAKLQGALDLSLTFLASFDHRKSMAAKPLFGVPDTLTESLDVFVLMPFKVDMLPVYEDHIKPTCASLNLTVRRDDDFFTVDSVINHIWRAIASARLIVADCTDRNPNVFYEIGMAHTIGKPTILIAQKSEDVPFDLRHLRYIAYQHTPRGMKEFEQKFQETVRNVLDIPRSAK
jgi:hypothetical protein